MTGLSDSMLTTTVAPAGMLSNTRPICPPFGAARFPGTLKTCFALVPSPVKVASLLVTTTVPVAVALATQAETSSICVSADWYGAAASGSLIAWPVGSMETVPVSVPA